MERPFVFLLGPFFFMLFFVAPVQAEERKIPTIVQMADGRFYDMERGVLAATESELRAWYDPASTTKNSVPTSTSTSTSVLLSDRAVSIVLNDAPLPVVAPTSSVSGQNVAGVLTLDQLDFPLRRAVEKGRALLREELAQDQMVSGTVHYIAKDDGWRAMTLAIWQKDIDQVTLVSVKVKGSELVSETGSIGASIRTALGREHKTQFSLDDPNLVVVGLRYPSYTKEQLTKKKVRYRVEEFIYTPYSKALNTPEMAAYGRASLKKFIQDLYDELRFKGIYSRAEPERLLSDVIHPLVAESILMIEHLGNQGLETAPREAMDLIYVQWATNPENAFAFDVSTAGARGAVQFIPSTYKGLVKSRPELELIPDFVEGMSDVHNAIKASIAYLDIALAEFSEARQETMVDQGPLAQDIIVAAYNGGSGRIKKALNTYGEHWDQQYSAQANSLYAEVKKMKKTLKSSQTKLKTASGKKKEALKLEIASLQKEIKTKQAKADELSSAAIRGETFYYVRKFHAVINALQSQDVPSISG
jgi:hypothetical protein